MWTLQFKKEQAMKKNLAAEAAKKEQSAVDAVREPRVVYDVDALDDVAVKNMYIQAERVATEGKAVEAQFKCYRHELDFDAISEQLDTAVKSIDALRAFMKRARVALVVFGLAGVLMLSGCGQAKGPAVTEAAPSTSRPVCLDGKCSK